MDRKLLVLHGSAPVPTGVVRADFGCILDRSGDRIIVGGRDKLVHAVDAKSGKTIWTPRTRVRVESSPAIADGRIVIGDQAGHLFCFGQ